MFYADATTHSKLFSFRFGAYFGMAVSRALGEPKPRCKANADSNAVSDVMCLIGTTILWVFWPSFVGATETANPVTEHLCILHTVLALLGSTVATFCFSARWTQGNRVDPVHIANATLVSKSSVRLLAPTVSYLLILIGKT